MWNFAKRFLKSRETVVRKGKNDKGNAKVALPLIYENLIIGVLYVNIHENFETETRIFWKPLADNLPETFSERNYAENLCRTKPGGVRFRQNQRKIAWI